MVTRRNLKKAHENTVLQDFSKYVENQGNNFKIIETPDPPDAIVEINGKKVWVEITDAFLDEDHAIGLTSGASEDSKYISDSGRLVIEPDTRFSSVLKSVIEEKLNKESMRPIHQTLGPGILLVGVFTPFSSAFDISQSEVNIISDLVANKTVKVFDIIYVYDGTGQRSFYPICT